MGQTQQSESKHGGIVHLLVDNEVTTSWVSMNPPKQILLIIS